MSKAFTREDDRGLEPVAPERPAAHAPITQMGYAALTRRLSTATAARDAAAEAAIRKQLAAGTIAPPADRLVAGLGAEVTLHDDRGSERIVRLVTSGEVGVVPGGATPASPIGAAVFGGRVGDIVEIPEGGRHREATIVRIAWAGESG